MALTKVTTHVIADDIALPGNPTTTTQSTGNDTTRIATTAFVQTELASLVDSAPSTLNTLNELAAALGDDANFSTTVTNSIAAKLPLAGGTLTGALVAPQLTVDNVGINGDTITLTGASASGFIQTSSNVFQIGTSTDDKIDFFTNNSVAATLLSNGNLGIGITSPAVSSKLHLYKASAGTPHYDTYATQIIEDSEARLQLIATDGGNNAASLLLSNEDKHWGIANHGTSSSNRFAIGYKDTSSSNTDIIDAQDDIFNITTGGSVGIGTTSPNSILHVGSSNATGDASNPAIQIGGSTTYRLGLYTAAETAFIENKNGDDGIAFRVKTATEMMRLQADGVAHITSAGSPIAPTIKHSGGTGDLAKLRLINRSGQSSNKGGLVELGGVTDDGVSRSDVFASIAGLKSNATSANRAGYLQFSTSSGSALAERMRIDSSGRVAIGVTNPSDYYATNLVVQGASEGGITIASTSTQVWNYIMFADGTSGDARYRGYLGYNHNNDSLAIATAGTQTLRVDSDGLKFGSDSAAANALDDYEEGSFTPSMTGFTGTTVAAAQYTKIGRLVSVDLRLRWTGTDNTTNLIKFGLPFTSAGPGDAARTSIVFYSGTAIYSGAPISGHIGNAGSEIAFYRADGGSFTPITRNLVNGTYDWLVSFSYFTS